MFTLMAPQHSNAIGGDQVRPTVASNLRGVVGDAMVLVKDGYMIFEECLTVVGWCLEIAKTVLFYT